jgi:hypothetical protein
VSATLDPRKAHLVRHHGEIMAIFTWINQERAMVLVASRRPPGSPWYCIMESAAYLYADESGNPTRRLIESAAKASEVLCLNQTNYAVKKIVDIIVDGLPDLIKMPSAPPNELAKHAIGEMQLRANGELVSGREIREEVTGVEYA